MPESPLDLQTDQITDILRDFISLRGRLTNVLPLPEDLTRAKQRLDIVGPEDRAGRLINYGLYYAVGVALSRKREPQTMGELSQALVVPPSMATRIADWLVAEEYAERLPDPKDRRIVRLTLTEAGREFYQTINEFIRQRVKQILGPFTTEEREALVLLLRKLMKTIEELNEGALRGAAT